MLTELTNEQKLSEVYDILKNQESRRKRAFFYRLLKWATIFSILYLVYSNQALAFDMIKSFVKPILSKTIDTVLNDPDIGMMKSVKEMIPKDLMEISTNTEIPKIETTPIPVNPKKTKK